MGSTDIEMSLFERAAELADEAARLLEETGRARERGRRADRARRAPHVGGEARYPDQLRELVESFLEGLDSPPRPRRGRSSRRCAIRCWPAASASAPCSAWPWPSGSAASAAGAAVRRGSRADPYLLSHPRRSAGHRQRRLRRGVPTCHVRFGEDIAILAGDGLFAEAFRLITDRQEGDARPRRRGAGRGGGGDRRAGHGRRAVHGRRRDRQPRRRPAPAAPRSRRVA